MQTPPAADWAATWLDYVARNPASMSQRRLAAVEKNGGLAHVRAVAEAKGVHLLLLEDNHGTKLVAASTQPFRVIC